MSKKECPKTISELGEANYLDLEEQLRQWPTLATDTDKEDLTLLHYVVRSDNVLALGRTRLLLDTGADPNAKASCGHAHPWCENGWTPLHVAADSNTLDIARLLIERGADPNANCAVEGEKLTDDGLWEQHSLEVALTRGSVDFIAMLLDHGADIESTHMDGRHPLHTAIEAKMHLVAEYLISRGADVNAEDGIGWQPIHFAAHRNNVRGLELLIRHGADTSRCAGILFSAAGGGAIEVVRLLLERGDDPNQSAPENLNTSLHAACRSNAVNVAALLIEHGADINATNLAGETPLDWAEEQGGNETCRLLRKNGART